MPVATTMSTVSEPMSIKVGKRKLDPMDAEDRPPKRILKRAADAGLKGPAGGFARSMCQALVQDALRDLESGHGADGVNALTTRLVRSASGGSVAGGAGGSTDSGYDDVQLRYVIEALAAEVSRLDNHPCTELISTALKLKWSSRDGEFVEAYARFLGVLVSGIPKWWPEVASKMVGEFGSANTDSHHSVLKYILWLIPTAASSIREILERHFPYPSESITTHQRYIGNLLTLIGYCEDIRPAVWDLIVNRVVRLDLELYEDIEEDEDEGDDEDEDDEDDLDDAGAGVEKESPDYKLTEQTLSAIEAGSDDEDSEIGDDEGSEYDVEEVTVDYGALKRKLDAVFVQLFDYLESKFTPSALESGEAAALFKLLLDAFRKNVISAHRTRSAQYLLFKVAHAHPDLLDAYLSYLITLALDPSGDASIRQKATQYISSFTARAKGLPKSTILLVVSYLKRWLERYVGEREVEVDAGGGSMGRFRMFYSMSQAMFYIFCFRHAELRKDDGSGEWECELDSFFQRLILTKFNPLRYCKRTVVAMFARIAQHEDVAYCFSILEQNRFGGFRQASPQPGSSQSTVGNWNPNEPSAIEGYFPFDPLVLPQTRKRIESFYVSWDQVADSDSGSEYDEDDEDDDEAEEEDKDQQN